MLRIGQTAFFRIAESFIVKITPIFDSRSERLSPDREVKDDPRG